MAADLVDGIKIESSVRLSLSSDWLVFGPVDRQIKLPFASLIGSRSTLELGGANVCGREVAPRRGQYDFHEFLAEPPRSLGQALLIFATINADSAGPATIGFGWDYWLSGWLNGEPLFQEQELESRHFPPAINDRLERLHFREGENTLVLRIVSGRGRCLLALGVPEDLVAGDFRSIVDDPIYSDPKWTVPNVRVPASSREVISIGTRRELFVDDHIIEQISAQAERRLHHPTPREVVLTLDQPWEGNFSGNFMPVSIVKDNDRHLLYYYGANWSGPGGAHTVPYEESKVTGGHPVTCVAETRDGIHFSRKEVSLLETSNHPKNNIVWNGLQYFTPFKDENPSVPKDEAFKAIVKHLQGGVGGCVSPDGIRWQMIEGGPMITEGAFDSQNLAFWDAERSCYVEYHRGPKGSAQRGIMMSRSADFRHWTKPEPLIYSDRRPEHLYTNCIQSYQRAPHLLLGTPARFVGARQKDPSHLEFGISDAILMSSRDGLHFDRWEEGFIRPGLDAELWTDRNNYPAWGMIQTSPSELSLYWCEHNGHPGLRLRRGTLRLDGFVSLHSGSGVGEMLTKPLLMSGNRLEVNYATSATGTILFELCDEAGEAFEGFALEDSEVLYGNECSHIVSWRGSAVDLGSFCHRPVRLRVRLKDADLFSFRFAYID